MFKYSLIMTSSRNLISLLTLFLIFILLVPSSGCKKDEDPAPTPARTTTYDLLVTDVLGVSGKAKFTETSSTLTTIDIVLSGAPSGTHPAELRMNSVVEGGAVVIALNPVDDAGNSSTVTTAMTYSQLIAYDGFIQVHKSSSEPNVILAEGDIGGNALTTISTTYTLDTIGSFGVSGTALFQKRMNGNTLVTVTLSGTISGEFYPSTINLGSIESVGGGPVVKALNDVDGTKGKGYTNIKDLDSGLAITYDNWLVYDGYINIYLASVSIDNIICHGNIGSN
jgi:hypothetical protein